MTDSAVLGGVVEVVSSIPAVGHKKFSAFSGIVDLLYLFISIFIIYLCQFLILCSSKVLFEQSFYGVVSIVQLVEVSVSEFCRSDGRGLE